ncbi:MAG: dipeptidase [Acidobacteriaceae bacterium]
MTDRLSLHRASLVIDTHADTPQRLLDEDFDLTDELRGGHFNFAAAEQGNLGAEFFAIWVDPKFHPGRFAHRTLALMDAVLQQAAKHPDKLQMAYSADDILAAQRNGKLALLMGIEGGHSIENDLGLLRMYHRLGARYMTLTWANSNEWADSSGDLSDVSVPHHNGLTDFGRSVVREMNKLGMMVDVSHVSDKTFQDVREVTTAPILASHSNARSLCHSPRNLTDEMLQQVAATNGVVMVNFFSAFVDEDWRVAWEAQKPEMHAALTAEEASFEAQNQSISAAHYDRIVRQFAAKLPRPPFHSLIDQFDHIAKVAGVAHVGIGSDFDGIPAMPKGLNSAADLPKITEALMARGYTADQMQKILGGNLLRVFRDVERVAQEQQSR